MPGTTTTTGGYVNTGIILAGDTLLIKQLWRHIVRDGIAVYGTSPSTADTVSNAGSIGNIHGQTGTGTSVASGGEVINASTGVITGVTYGVSISGGGGQIIGYAGTTVSFGAGGSVTNTTSGLISGYGGDARLPLGLFGDAKGPLELTLHLGGTTRYPLLSEAAA